MSIKTAAIKAGFVLRKNSPAIFTGVGIVGLAATAYLAYRSRDKVEVVVEEIERKRDLDKPISKMEVARDMAEAIYKPVVVGAASVACILLAQKIQNNRIKTLVGALAVEQARNLYFEKKYRKQHGDEEYNKFIVPTDDVESVEMVKGKEKVTVQQVKKDVDQTIGQWYDQSSEYVSDDHSYNIAFIDSVNEKMQTLLFQRGTLLLNEVREELGFERIRNGALLGWTTRDNFEIDKSIAMLGDESVGENKEQIWVYWSKPRYVYGDMEFNGRYSIYGK